jgi:hypothetical protein
LECEFHRDNLWGSLILAWWDLESAIGFFSFGMMVLQLESPILVWWEWEWEQEEVAVMERERDQEYNCNIDSQEPFQREM